MSLRLARQLREHGWRLHQHSADVFRCRDESVEVPGVRDDPECRAVAMRIQAIVDSMCYNDPPELDLPHNPWPCTSGATNGMRFQFVDQRRPSEYSPTDLNDERSARVIWRTVVAEMATGWATCDQEGLSFGRLFLGPRDRMLFWTKELNTLLLHLRVSYGRVLDLFAIAVTCGLNLDLKSAYRGLRLDLQHARYHAAIIDGAVVLFLRASFGCSQSPVAFVTFLDVTLRRYRSEMHATLAALYQFMDDSNVGGITPLQALLACESLVIALARDKWWISSVKTFVLPAAPLYATGIMVHFANGGSLAIHREKCEKALELLREVTRPRDDAIAAAYPRDPSTATCPVDLRRYLDQPRIVCLEALPIGSDGALIGRPFFVVADGSVDASLLCGLPTPAATVHAADLVSAVAAALTRWRPVDRLRSAAYADTLAPAVVVACPSSARAQDFAASIPTSIIASHPTAVLFPTNADAAPPSVAPMWFDPADRIPDRIILSNRQPLPTARSMQLPQQEGDRIEITGREYGALRKVTGYLSYFQCVLSFIGYWRVLMSPLVRNGKWCPVSAAGFDSVFALLSLAHEWQAPVAPKGPELYIVPDAGAAGWGAAIVRPGASRPVFRAGVLTATERGESSTGREACGALRGARSALDDYTGPLGRLRILPDNLPLVCSAKGRLRSVATARTLSTFAAWAIQGLTTTWEHQSRWDEEHAAPDALAVAAAPRAWGLRLAVASLLWDAVGGWSIHAGASDESRTVAAYATISSASFSGRDRFAVLCGLAQRTPSPPEQPGVAGPRSPPGTDSSLDSSPLGWLGPLCSLVTRDSDRLLVTPLWSELPEVVRWWSDHPCDAVVIAPAENSGEWWQPSLSRLAKEAQRVVELPRRSLQAPSGPGPPTDPRRIAAYVLSATSSPTGQPTPFPNPDWLIPADQRCTCSSCGDIHRKATGSTPNGRHPGWDRTCLCACGDVHPHPGPGSGNRSASAFDSVFGRVRQRVGRGSDATRPPSGAARASALTARLPSTDAHSRPTLDTTTATAPTGPHLPPPARTATTAAPPAPHAPHRRFPTVVSRRRSPTTLPPTGAPSDRSARAFDRVFARIGGAAAAPPPAAIVRPTPTRHAHPPPPGRAPQQPPTDATAPARGRAPATRCDTAAHAIAAPRRFRAPVRRLRFDDIFGAVGPAAPRDGDATAQRATRTATARLATPTATAAHGGAGAAGTAAAATAGCAAVRTAAADSSATRGGPDTTDPGGGARTAVGGAATAPQGGAARPPTVGMWIEDILAAHGGRPVQRMPPGVASVHAAALRAHTKATTQKANVGSSAPVAITTLLKAFATRIGVLDHPWSLDEVEALVLHFVQTRTERHDNIPGWGNGVSVRVARANASTLAAASRRALWAVPQFCGPMVEEWTRARGGTAKAESSAAWPLHIKFLLDAEPPRRSHPDWPAWAALILMSLFCLRSGIVQHLRRHMLIPYDGGYILVWRFTQKATGQQDDPADPDALSRVGSITAARHPALTRIIGDTSEGPDAPVLPDVTTEAMSAFVKRVVPGCPKGFDIRVYGCRVAAAKDAKELNLAHEEVCVMFWWKRGDLPMSSYYAGVNIRQLFVFSERRCMVQYRHVAPGRYDAIIPDASLRDWSNVNVASRLPDPPSWAAIGRAMNASCPSLVVARAVRAEVRRVRARRAAGGDSTESDSGEVKGLLRGACTQCRTAIGPNDDAAVCTRCNLMVCTDCHSDVDEDWRCPAHRPPRKLARKAGGRR